MADQVLDRESSTSITEAEYSYAIMRAANHLVEKDVAQKNDRRTTPPVVRSSTYKIAKADIRYLSSIISQLVALYEGDETDDYGELRPTKHSFERTCEILTDTAISLAREGRRISHGCVSTDTEGGVRVEWRRAHGNLHLVIPSDERKKSYIYHEIGDDFGTVEATSQLLGHWLKII